MGSKILSISELNLRKHPDSYLTAAKYVGQRRRPAGSTVSMYVCLCQCGNEKLVTSTDFTRGNPLSCGCKPKKTKYKYGGPKYKRLFQQWRDLIARHENKSHASYKHYGAKGSKICPEWYEYDNYAEWALNNGYQDNLELDKDILNNGTLYYSPQTCKFVTRYENSCNRSTSKKFTFNGQLLTLSQIATITGVRYSLLKARVIQQKKTIDKAIAME